MSEKSEKLNFENALERLQTILESMEKGDIPLAELIGKFEEGSILLQTCQKKLQTAELKIEQLTAETGKLSPFEDQKIDD